MATKIQIRRDTAANWSSNNPTLSAGEFGFETDTGKFKIGTGSALWSALSYASVLPSDLSELSQDAVNSALTAGTGITKSYNDGANTISLSVDTSVIAERAYVDSAVSNLIDGAPGLLDTLNELAAAVNDDPTFFTTVSTNLSNHESDTTNIHGIADTANLVTKTGTETLTNKTISGSSNTLTNIPNSSLSNSDITINGTAVSLGGSRTLGTDDISEGSTNKYFTNERAQDAVAEALAAGSHSGITVTYSDLNNSISLAAGAAIVPSGSIETAEPQTGQLFFDTDVNSLKIYYGGIWLVLATVSPLSGGSPEASSFEYEYSGGSPSEEPTDVLDGGTPSTV